MVHGGGVNMFLREISASLYAWDLADEGIERILDNLQQMTATNSVYLVTVMHHEKRPLTDHFYPHNPVRKTYYPEDSAAYFRPDPSFYKRITPRTSQRAFLQGTDWLETLTEAARRRGMRTGAELSHTLLDEERAVTEFADCVQRNIYGEQLGKLLCLNNPDVRDYVGGLFADLATRYDIDYIQTCLIPFATPFGSGRAFTHDAACLWATTLSGCFCPACHRAAAEAGLDLAEIRQALRPLADTIMHPSLEQGHELALLQASNTTPTALLLEQPALYHWLLFRRNSLTGFFREIHDRIHAIRPNIDLRLNAYITSNHELNGLDLRALKPHLDSIRSSDYSEQTGDPARLESKRRWLLAVRRAVGEDMPFLSAIGVRPRATPELVRQGVVISCQCGVDGLTIGHYDGATFSCLRAIKEGLALADVELLRAWRTEP
jgi:hypothetical protein